MSPFQYWVVQTVEGAKEEFIPVLLFIGLIALGVYVFVINVKTTHK